MLYSSYLELAILPCWRFLSDDIVDILPRLVAMMRGLGDPLASAYCHLYLAYSAQKLAPHEKGIWHVNLFCPPFEYKRISLKGGELISRVKLSDFFLDVPMALFFSCMIALCVLLK